MAYYSALQTEWANLSGTTAQKLAAINALTSAGPNQDIPIPSIIAYLALNNKLVPFQNYANGSTGNAAAIQAAKTFFMLAATPGISSIQTSNATVAAQFAAMLGAVIADMANSGITSADETAVMAYAATTVPWWQANGYSSPFNDNDLAAAGGLT